MNIPEQFIRRPVMTTLVTAAITLFGWMAYERLPVSDLPNVDFPTISVSASRSARASACATPSRSAERSRSETASASATARATREPSASRSAPQS